MPTPVAVAPTPIKAPVAVAAPEPEKFYDVLEEIKIPRGASTFTLRAGKTISSRGYNIAQLESCGAKLKLKGS